MASAYLVQVPAEGGQNLINGANAMVVYAESSADAKAFAKSKFSGDSAAMWAAATVTALAAGADLEGWRLRIALLDAATPVDVTVTGAASATVDSLGALAVTALNALATIAGAAYNSSTNVLTVAETTDNLGAATLTAQLLPPATYGDPTVAIPSFITTVVNAGASNAAVKCTLVQSAVPAFYASVAVVA
jgi:hypothetical protein